MCKKLKIGQLVDRFEIDQVLNDNKTGIDRYLAHDNSGMKVMLQLCDLKKMNGWGYELYELEGGNLSNNLLFSPVFQSDVVKVGGRVYNYMVRQYIDGQSLADCIAQHGPYSWDEAVRVIMPIVNGMIKLSHKRKYLIINNDITCKNIIVQGSISETPRVFLVSTNHMSEVCLGIPTFSTHDLNPLYCSSESYKGLYTIASDIFSMGVVLYTMLSGAEPWQVEFPENVTEIKARKMVLEARKATDINALIDNLPIEKHQKAILQSMLALWSQDRYDSYLDLKRSLVEGRVVKYHEPLRDWFDQDVEKRSRSSYSNSKVKESTSRRKSSSTEKVKQSGGFADVAGMDEVKAILRNEVMYAMKNRERMKEYKITPPNGMLLYGPPGCGKTFIAEKFAQESGMDYMMVNGSDLGGIYVHESQGKIADLFKDAAKRAPIILCFDELDGMVGDRNNAHNQSYREEVTEFLGQLNNCGEKGIFVIGTTNCPQAIDTAIMRTGRLDKLVYIPAPDKDARRGLIEFEMRDRKSEGDFDYEMLAEASKDCVSSDISCMINEVALMAAMSNVPINQQQLLDKFRTGRRSVNQVELKKYNTIYSQFGGAKSIGATRKIGYKPEW